MIKQLLLLTVLTCVACSQTGSEAVAFDPDAAAKEWNTAQKTWTVAELEVLEQGKQLYARNCAGCHLRNGEGQLTIGAPSLIGSAIVEGPLINHIAIVWNGKRPMPGYSRSLSAIELAAVISYERNAWGNNEGVIVKDDAIYSALGIKK